MKRFVVQKSHGPGWRVVDIETGRLHTAAKKHRAMAQRIADRMNDRLGRRSR